MLAAETIVTLIVGGASTFAGGFIAMKVTLARLEERIKAAHERITTTQVELGERIVIVRESSDRAHERIDRMMHSSVHTPGVKARRTGD